MPPQRKGRGATPSSSSSSFPARALVEPRNKRWELLLSDREDHSPAAAAAVGVALIVVALALVALAVAIMWLVAERRSESAAGQADHHQQAQNHGVPVTGPGFYVLLVPLTLPPTFVAVYFNWLSFRFFESR